MVSDISTDPFCYGEKGQGYGGYKDIMEIMSYHGRLGVTLYYTYYMRTWMVVFFWDLVVVACILFNDTITEGKDRTGHGEWRKNKWITGFSSL